MLVIDAYLSFRFNPTRHKNVIIFIEHFKRYSSTNFFALSIFFERERGGGGRYIRCVNKSSKTI